MTILQINEYEDMSIICWYRYEILVYLIEIPIKQQCYCEVMMRQSRPLLYPQSIKQENFSSQDQQIVVKNLDTGQTQSGNQLTKKLNSISVSHNPWEQYFNSRKKLDQKLLQLVTKNQHENLESLLIEFSIDLNSMRFMGGWTLLHFAISKNGIVAADLLLKFGLDVNSKTDEMHRTALHEAALGNKIEIVELLIGWGADPNVCDSDRNTAMHFAVDYGYLEVVKALLASSTSVDLNIRNNTNMNPFNTCRNSQIFEILIMYEDKMSKTSQNHSKKTADTILKNSTSKTIYQSRLIKRNSDIIHNISRVDQVEKFLSLRQNPVEKKPSNASNDSVISEQSYEQSLVQDAPQPQTPLNLAKSKQKIKRIGSGLRNNLTKSSFRIASQNIGLMRQSIFKTHLQNEEVIDNFNILRKIGSGAFGKVYLVRKKRSNKLYALKQMQKTRIAQEGLRKYVDAQRFVLTQIKHPFLLHASYCLQDFNNLYILTEYCAGGDLQKVVRDQVLDQNIAKTYICEAVLGIQELHKNKILYRDLKASNTLLDSEGHIRLADFGLAKNAVSSTSFLGSMNYIAPEMLVHGEQKNHGQALDWYLLGVFAYQLLHGVPPFYSQDRFQMQKKVRQDDPQINVKLSPQCKEVIKNLLKKNPSQRTVGFDKLKQSAWFRQVDWKAIFLRKGEVLKLQIPNLKSLLKKEYFQQQFNHQLIDQTIEWYENWNYTVTQ